MAGACGVGKNDCGMLCGVRGNNACRMLCGMLVECCSRMAQRGIIIIIIIAVAIIVVIIIMRIGA